MNEPGPFSGAIARVESCSKPGFPGFSGQRPGCVRLPGYAGLHHA